MCLDDGEKAVKTKQLKEVRRLITKVLCEPRLEPGQRDRLRSMQRELEKIGRSGKLDPDRIFRVTEGIASVLLEIVEQDEAARWPR
jgi:hypothetical protein